METGICSLSISPRLFGDITYEIFGMRYKIIGTTGESSWPYTMNPICLSRWRKYFTFLDSCWMRLRPKKSEVGNNQVTNQKSPHDPAGGGTEGRRRKQQWWWKQSSQQQISQDMTGVRKRKTLHWLTVFQICNGLKTFSFSGWWYPSTIDIIEAFTVQVHLWSSGKG